MQAEPAQYNHGQHQRHYRAQDPEHGVKGALVFRQSLRGQHRLRATPFGIDRLRVILLLFDVLFEHRLQLFCRQHIGHIAQAFRQRAVLLFHPLRQVIVQTRRVRHAFIVAVVLIRFRQLVTTLLHQAIQPAAVDIARHIALQTQHAAVKRNAHLVEADPCIGERGNVLTGRLRDVEIGFVFIQRLEKQPARKQLHRAENNQHHNQAGYDFDSL